MQINHHDRAFTGRFSIVEIHRINLRQEHIGSICKKHI